MPEYMATVMGENFDFMVDDERQLLEFSRTLCVNAADEKAAEAEALAKVREELLAQSILDDDSDQLITIDEIRLAEGLSDKAMQSEFIWYFPEEDEFDDE